MFFKGLRRDSRVSGVLTGDHQAAVGRVFANCGLRDHKNSVLSSDLTAASDLLPLDLVRSLVDGLLADQTGLPDWCTDVLYRMTGS
jgi:hypothetical protein